MIKTKVLRLLILVITILIAITLLIVFVSFAEGDNLIQNGDYEIVGYWQYQSTPGGECLSERRSCSGKSGWCGFNYANHEDCAATPPWVIGHWQDVISSTYECPAGTYYVHFDYMRSNDVAGGTLSRWQVQSEGGTVYYSATLPYTSTEVWYEYNTSFVASSPVPNCEFALTAGAWSSWYYDNIYFSQSPFIPPATPTPLPPSFDCGLQNYSFNYDLEDWETGPWITWFDDGYIELYQSIDEIDSYVSQPITLSATGPTEHYEISISARQPYPMSPGSEPLLRWKLNSQIPGIRPEWYQDQMHIFFHDWWQHNASYLWPSNSPAITDTLTIWTANNAVQIDNVCITFHSGPATMTPVCPISPTYTPEATYTPLPTPTPVNTATATAWAATATAWATQEPLPTEPPPNCPSYSSNEPGWDFIWLAGQVLRFLTAFFEAIFKLLATILQPLFDFFGFIIWLAGAIFSLVASIIDLLAAALQFLFSFIGLFFDILEIIGAFIVALWNVLTISPTDPGVEIPTYFAWGIAVWDFLIEGTALEYLELIAIALGSLLIIRWTVRQFSDWGG